MFRKRITKTFPPGTFIPFPARLAAITQLCLAFTFLSWCVLKPFMNERFALKSQLNLYDYAIGQKEFFLKLSSNKQDELLLAYRTLKEQAPLSFLDKSAQAFFFLAFGLSPFQQGWLLLSLCIPILLLKRVEGAVHAAWLLPLLTITYAIDSYESGRSVKLSEEAKLFPSEEVIVQNYLGHPLSTSIFEQREELKKGWHLYLIKEWAKELPSPNEKEFAYQMKKGEYAFNLARIKTSSLDKHSKTEQKELVLLLILYFLWNTAFACLAGFKQKAA